jgi:phosphate transport system substrate-binding protein
LRSGGLAAALASALALSLAGCGSTPTQSQAPISLQETGSTLLLPLFQIWAPVYLKDHDVEITPQGTGSGTGISYATNGTVQIGASDAYMADAQMSANPGMLNIPLAISAQQIMYNIPRLNKQHLHLSGQVLALIYKGTIQMWNAPQIKALNPGFRLPALRIVPIHRADGSGDTFLFSQYLSFSNPTTWGSKSGPQYATTISWPSVPASLSATGNGGMVEALQQNRGGIAYVGISYLDQAVKNGLGYAAIENRAGQFELPTAQSIATEAQSLVGHTPKDARVSLIYGPAQDA